MPGRASSCSLVAVFKSTRPPAAGAAAADCAAAVWLCGRTGTERTNSSDAASSKDEKPSFRFIDALLFETHGEHTKRVAVTPAACHACTLAAAYNTTESHFDSTAAAV